ncbi:sickle tail protein homolog isoform X4 [Megalobrama amblycephala]|uniref:sickle tail protein homolog isoform X4 n=1 Tax=Megalobrama amblycephala TaxID=75352 RepID=UPI0020145962|nr:sickle tail protein homolog isoform X4 [Megalobrama amblycephala]
MSKPSRLARPSSAGPGSKLPSPRRDTPAGRSRMLGMGEKVMRTGSEGNIAGQRPPINGTTHSHITQNTNIKEEDEVAQPRSRISPPKGSTASITQQQVTQPKPLKGNLKVTSSEDAEHLTRKQQVVSANSPGFRCEPKSARAGAPRRHTVGGARSSREILAMQPSDMDKKREAFLEHLKQKYPHHASAIMGHQERLREQLFQGMLSALHSEIDIQRYLMKIQNVGSRRNRSSKQSVVCSSPVPVFVDQVEHDSLVSLDALEVMSECDMPIAFTRGSRSRASLPVVRSTNQTKDRSLGVLYLQYGDDTKQIRMPNEITSVDTVRALFVSAFPHQLNMKMLESPSTAIYVKDETRNVYYELTDVRNITDHSCLKVYHKDPAHAFSHGARPSNGDARVHREMMYAGRDGHPLRQPPMGPPPPHMQGSMSPTTPHALPPSPSRIPFGPRTSGGGVATMPRERAGHTLPAPARASSPCPSAILERRDVKPDEDVAAKSMSLPSRAESHYADPYMLHHQALPPDAVDHAYHRATIRSYSNPGVPMEPMDHHSLFRQKSRKYTDSQLPMLGSKTPPSSPHRMGEMRMMDIHTGQPQSSMTLERASPVRQSFRKEAPVTMDTMVKTRGGMGSPATPDLQVHNPLAPSTDPQTREKPVKSGSPAHSTSSTGGSPVLPPKLAAAPPEHSPAPTPPLGPAPLHVNLHLFRRNVSELRLQLQHIRQLQLQNQECVRAQIKHAEQEISVKLAEILRRQDDPTQKQRTLVEEERHRYLSMQERVLTQLGDLEQYVEALRTDSSPAVSQRAVTLKEVEEGAVSLRKVGENLAGLKGEFPALQAHMRAVLRVEVEAVKFLKEEPHKLDSMLKRVRTLTDTLGNLRRYKQRECATDSLLNPSDPVPSTPASEKAESAIVESFEPASVIPQSSIVRSEVMSSSPMVIHHAQASPVASQQSLKSTAPSPIPPAAQRRESTPSPTKQLKKPSLEQTQIPNTSSNGVSANDIHSKGPSPNLLIEEIQASHSKNMNRAVSIEAAEKGWEEKRQNIGHYDGQEFERMLQEAEANMLRGIPNLEVPSKLEGSPAPPASLEEVIEKNEPIAAPTEQDDNQPNSEKPTKTAPEKPPKPLEKAVKSALERPIKPSLSIKSNLERQNKTQEKVKLQTTEKANKSPPPPPPRRNYTTNTGMTTTRSGEVIYTSRKESVTEGEEESNSTASQSEPKTPPEAKHKPITPPPIAASAITEEEDEGDKIMAELQVFQKCSVKEVGLKGLVEPQIRELRPGVLLPLKDKKNTENQDDKNPDTDENGNNTIRQSPGVIYYVTAQISKGTSSASEESTERRDASQSPPSQVSHVNASDQSQSQLQVSTNKFGALKSSGPASSSSSLHQNQLSRSASLKSNPPSPLEELPGSPTQGKVHVVKAAQVQVSIEERVESPTSICSPVSFGDTEHSVSKAIHVGPDLANQKLLFGSSKAKERKFEEIEENDEAFLSPDLPGEEPPPPPPDNFAFMITNTKVQALSTGEYHQLVNAKKGSVQTVTVGNKRPSASDSGSASRVDANTNGPPGADKKPVIIIFDEPMDIRSAYKRLSTVFECEEELERMLAEERIDEESEETEEEEWTRGVQVKHNGDGRDSGNVTGSNSSADVTDGQVINSLSSSSLSEGGALVDVDSDAKQDGKKKFKFKFPKKQFAALTQAIRAGSKTGKKTLQVVVYEDEEESDGTVRQHKETKRFEIACSKTESSKSNKQEPNGRTDEIRKSTYKTLDSLEQTIKQLESTICEMGPKSSEDPESLVNPETQDKSSGHSEKGLSPKTFVSRSTSASKVPGLRKKTKPQLLPRPAIIPTTGVSVTPVPTQQNASVVSPTSRMPVPVSAKARQQPGTSDKERATKPQKLQDSQRQFRQANGSAKRSGGDPKSTSPTVPASKIPAFSSSTGKGLSQSDSTNIVNSSPLSSSLPASKSSIPPPRSNSTPSSHIPSLSNGSLKFAPPTHSTKGLSIPMQTQNGRPSTSSSSSSSCSHSPLSPTMLNQSAKSIRTIHTPSFTSYSRPHNGSAGKSAIPTVTVAKDAA